MAGRPQAVDFVTLPYPGFATDLQPMAIALSAVADGTSMITENVFEARFRFVDEMIRLGRGRPHRRAPRRRPRASSSCPARRCGPATSGRAPGWCWPGCAPTARPRCGTSRTSTAATRGSSRTCARWAPTSSGWPATPPLTGRASDWEWSSSGITRSGDARVCSTRRTGPMTDAAGTARQVAQSEPVKIGARIGLVAYGITHLLIAWLALQVAFGWAGSGPTRTAPSRRSPRAVRAGAAVGARRRVRRGRAVAPRAGDLRHGRRTRTTKKQIKKRVERGGQAVVFVALAVIAAPDGGAVPAAGAAGRRPPGACSGWPGGQFLVGRSGWGSSPSAVVKAKHGWREEVPRGRWTCRPTSTPGGRRAASGRSGSIAKAVAIGLIGVLVVVAAVQFDPPKANGLDPALKTLAASRSG